MLQLHTISYNVTLRKSPTHRPVSGDDPSVARLLADDAVHPAVDPIGEGELHRARAESRDTAAPVGAPAHEGTILREQSVMDLLHLWWRSESLVIKGGVICWQFFEWSSS